MSGSMTTKRTELDKDTIRHALDVAARTFAEHAETFAKAEANPLMTAGAIKNMRDTFEHYRERTLAQLELVECAHRIVAEDDAD